MPEPIGIAGKKHWQSNRRKLGKDLAYRPKIIEIGGATLGTKCVTGINDLATLMPEIAAQWHPTKNGSLLPTEVSLNSNRKIWWRDSFGHAWKAPVARRAVSHSRCPFCYGKCVEKKLQEYERLYEEEMDLFLRAQQK